VLLQVARLADAELMTGVIELVKKALQDVALDGLQEQVGLALPGTACGAGEHHVQQLYSKQDCSTAHDAIASCDSST
jgi:hypothetical protein